MASSVASPMVLLLASLSLPRQPLSSLTDEERRRHPRLPVLSDGPRRSTHDSDLLRSAPLGLAIDSEDNLYVQRTK